MAKNTKNNTKTASIIKAVKKFSSDVIRLVEFGLVIASVYFFPAIITITIVSFVTWISFFSFGVGLVVLSLALFAMYYGYTKYKTNENGYTKSKENEKLDIFLSSFFDSYSREKRPKSDDELIEKIQKARKIIESEIKNNNKRYNKQQYQNALDMLDKFSKILKGDIQTEKGVNDYIDNDRSHDKVNNFLIYNFIKSGIEVVGNFFVNKTDKQEGIELLIQPQSKYEAQSSDFKSDYTGLTDGEKSPSIGVIRNDAKSQDVLSDPKMM